MVKVSLELKQMKTILCFQKVCKKEHRQNLLSTYNTVVLLLNFNGGIGTECTNTTRHCTVSQELTQPTPRILQWRLHIFMPGIFLCQPFTQEYAFIVSNGFLVVSDYLYLLNFSNRAPYSAQ